jgi:hypothetical protein
MVRQLMARKAASVGGLAYCRSIRQAKNHPYPLRASLRYNCATLSGPEACDKFRCAKLAVLFNAYNK